MGKLKQLNVDIAVLRHPSTESSVLQLVVDGTHMIYFGHGESIRGLAVSLIAESDRDNKRAHLNYDKHQELGVILVDDCRCTVACKGQARVRLYDHEQHPDPTHPRAQLLNPRQDGH